MRVPLFFVSIKLLWASIISSSIFLFILYQYSRLSIAKPIILSEGYMIYSCFCTHIRVIVRHSLTFLFLLGALTEIFLCSILITEIFHTFSLEILYNIIINMLSIHQKWKTEVFFDIVESEQDLKEIVPSEETASIIAEIKKEFGTKQEDN